MLHSILTSPVEDCCAFSILTDVLAYILVDILANVDIIIRTEISFFIGIPPHINKISHKAYEFSFILTVSLKGAILFSQRYAEMLIAPVVSRPISAKVPLTSPFTGTAFALISSFSP